LIDQEPSDTTNPPATPAQPSLVVGRVQQIKHYFQGRRPAKKEESAQDRASRRTANATVAIAFLTIAVVVVGGLQYLIFKSQLKVMADQLEEMRGTGKQTDELISENKSLVGAAQGQLETLRGQLDQLRESGRQTNILIETNKRLADSANMQAQAAVAQAAVAAQAAETARNSMLGSQRAWVGPRNVKMTTEPKVGEELEFIVEYQNMGREPASGFAYDLDPFASATDEEASKRIIPYMTKCLNTVERKIGQVVYATTGFSQYNLTAKAKKDFADGDMISGAKAIFLQGCFTYESIQSVHRTFFCYFYKAGRSRIDSLNICNAGHYAD
jgi:uncharacterized protein YoxC